MKKLIFNPFTRIAGAKALLAGLLAIILSGMLCYLSNTHFDGVIDTHFSDTGNIYIYMGEGLINLVSIVVIFSLTGLIIAGARFRFIDLLGTMALSRTPLLIVPVFSWIFPQQKVLDYFLYTFLKIGTPVTITNWDIAGFVIVMFIILLALIWAIALMYNAFRICMNIKGQKIVIGFIAGLILAEILSKIIFYYFIGSMPVLTR